MVTEKILEVEKIVEVLVEKIIYKDRPDEDCMSQDRFISIWNSLFKLDSYGNHSNHCLTEEQFVDIVS